MRSSRAALGVNSIGSELSFPNPYGYVRVYPDFSIEYFLNEVDRIKRLTSWYHWPSTLVAADDGIPLDAIQQAFKRKEVACDFVYLKDVAAIKGLEYQHLVLFLNRATFDVLENGCARLRASQLCPVQAFTYPNVSSKGYPTGIRHRQELKLLLNLEFVLHQHVVVRLRGFTKSFGLCDGYLAANEDEFARQLADKLAAVVGHHNVARKRSLLYDLSFDHNGNVTMGVDLKQASRFEGVVEVSNRTS